MTGHSGVQRIGRWDNTIWMTKIETETKTKTKTKTNKNTNTNTNTNKDNLENSLDSFA